MQRKCDHCGKEYTTDERNIKRGWGLCCSKSCAASKREQSKPGYNVDRVAMNNIRRSFYQCGENAPTIVGSSGIISGYTSEGYRIMDGTAYDEFDEPVYDVLPI